MTELLLGCGSRSKKLLWLNGKKEWAGLVRLDIEASHKPDVVHDLNVLPWPFDEDQFNEIHAYEVLEHLGQQGDARAFLGQFAEAWRILKPDGFLFATCPSVNSAWLWGDPSHRRVVSAETLYFLSQPNYTREVGVTPMSDFRSFYQADFECEMSEDDGISFSFALRAIKPSRIQVPDAL